MREGPWLGACGLLALCLSACASEPVSGVDWEGVEAQWSGLFHTSAVSPVLWVIAIDDAPTERARALRAAVASELTTYWDDVRNDSCNRLWDFAQYRPVRVRVLLVPSSDPTRALHAGILPELDLDTANVRSTTEGGVWEAAMTDAIIGLESEELEPNQILAALSYWAGLLDGTRGATNATEAAFLAGLEGEPRLALSVASTRDDESPLSAEQYSLRALTNAADHAKLDGDCLREEAPGLAPRLDRALPVVCGGPYLRSNLACKLGAKCEGRWPFRLESGQVSCRALVYVDEDASCPEGDGWLDPLSDEGERQPTWVTDPLGDDWPGRFRACEIRQLEGAALAACENDFECVGCEPGFCFRRYFDEQPADFLVESCADQGRWYSEQFRFVLSARSAHSGIGVMTCDLQTASDL